MNIIKSIPALRSAALASLVCLCTTPGWAVAPSDSVTVRFADLDLSTNAGASTLYTRIKWAARQVCGTEGRSLTEIAMWHRCVDATIADAVHSVNSPRLTALYTGKPAQPVTAMIVK
jgi:UrcA family protein